MFPEQTNKELPYLVVQEDPEDGCHHAQDVGAGDGVAQHDQGHRDHHDSLGGVGHGVAEGADEVKDAEGNDVLGKITESTDYKQHQGPGPMRHRALCQSKQQEKKNYLEFQVTTQTQPEALLTCPWREEYLH